jgi:hypothetical protein
LGCSCIKQMPSIIDLHWNANHQILCFISLLPLALKVAIGFKVCWEFSFLRSLESWLNQDGHINPWLVNLLNFLNVEYRVLNLFTITFDIVSYEIFVGPCIGHKCCDHKN